MLDNNSPIKNWKTLFKRNSTVLQKVVNQKIGNVGNQGIFSRVFFFQVFDFEYWFKIEKSEKKSRKNFRGFRGFRAFDMADALHRLKPPTWNMSVNQKNYRAPRQYNQSYYDYWKELVSNEILWWWSKWNIMKVIKMKYYQGDQNEILWRWSKWNIMKVIKMKYYKGDQYNIMKVINIILWRWSKWNIMKVIEMKYYDGDRNEILWRWSKWNIMKVIEMKYYEGGQNEILWRWS